MERQGGGRQELGRAGWLSHWPEGNFRCRQRLGPMLSGRLGLRLHLTSRDCFSFSPASLSWEHFLPNHSRSLLISAPGTCLRSLEGQGSLDLNLLNGTG